MEYSIKELSLQGISKNLVYEALKNGLPFSNEFIRNKRIFNETDLEIFKFYKEFGAPRTVSKYCTAEDISKNTTVLKQSQTVSKQDTQQFENSKQDINEIIKEAVSKEIKTVKKQFENKEEELLKEIKQKDNVIKIKDDQTQKYAILKVEEEKEKKQWIEKYEQENKKKGEWIKKFYGIKTYLIIFIFLFCLSIIFSVLLALKVINF